MPASETPKRPETSRPSKPTPAITGKVLPEREADESERRTKAFAAELNPSGEVGLFLCRLAATMSTRIVRCQCHETAMMAEKVRQAIAEIDFPEGIDGAGIARLSTEASHRAVFDASREATMARKYAAAAERTFFRALKELRLVEKQKRATQMEMLGDKLGSNLPGEMTDEEFDAMCDVANVTLGRKPSKSTKMSDLEALRARVDMPIAVGKRR